MVYVCDRKNNRIQVFQKDGKFVKEGVVSKTTLGEGAVWDVAFSRDPQQQFLYVADGQDQKVFILRRDTLEVVAQLRRRRTMARILLRRRQRGRSTRRATSTQARRSRASAAEVRRRRAGVDDDQQTESRHRWQRFVVAILGLGLAESALERASAAQSNGTVQAPRFEVDPYWPKPLPNHWVLGETIGARRRCAGSRVDRASPRSRQRRPKRRPTRTRRPGRAARRRRRSSSSIRRAICVGHWGGPGEGYEWPRSNHGIFIDYKDNVWIGGNDANDAHILKFTRDGKLLMQIGHQGKSGGSNDMENFGRVAKIFVDPESQRGVHRRRLRQQARRRDRRRHRQVQALLGRVRQQAGRRRTSDGTTRRAPPAQQFRNPVHCADLSNDGLLYVCDRPNDRIQVFKKDGKFVKEVFVATKTLGDGSMWDIAFSKDPQQKYLYLADGKNEKIYIIQRDTMEILTSFGDGGRQPGQFFAVHSIATDSKGNIYTTETYEGRRLQKFVYKGIGPVAKSRAWSGQSSVRLQPHHRR